MNTIKNILSKIVSPSILLILFEITLGIFLAIVAQTHPGSGNPPMCVNIDQLPKFVFYARCMGVASLFSVFLMGSGIVYFFLPPLATFNSDNNQFLLPLILGTSILYSLGFIYSLIHIHLKSKHWRILLIVLLLVMLLSFAGCTNLWLTDPPYLD